MSLRSRIARDLRHDRETLKRLTFPQKIRYLLDYYRGRMFALFCVLLALFYLGDLVLQSHRVIDLQGFFVNDRLDLFPAEELASEFAAAQKTPRGHRIAFEDSLYVDLGSNNEYNASSQGKIVAYVAARELDFLVAPEELALTYADSFPLYDLETLLPEELAGRLAPDLRYTKDGTGAGKACCLDLRGSRFLSSPANDGKENYYLLVLGYTERAEAVTDFIRWAYE